MHAICLVVRATQVGAIPGLHSLIAADRAWRRRARAHAPQPGAPASAAAS